MRYLLAVGAVAIIAGCGTGPDPAFQVRNFQSRSEVSEYGTTFEYTGTALQTAPQGEAGDYYVVFEIVRVTGGDPEEWPRDTITTGLMVRNGSADITFHAGYRGASETWPQAKLTIRPVGYIPIRPLRPSR